MVESNKSAGKILIGTIVSVSMDKTVVVDILRSKTHRLYGKSFKVNNTILAHNEIDGLNIGDEVTISETRPLSKNVSFKVIKGNK